MIALAIVTASLLLIAAQVCTPNDNWPYTRGQKIGIALAYLGGYPLLVGWGLMGRLSRKHSIAIVLALLVFSLGLLRYLPYSNDDAFIFFRYAANIVDHGEAAYNPGQRVEGYTSTAWVALLTLARWLGFDVLFASKAMGIILGMGILFFTYCCAVRVSGNQSAAFLTTVTLAASQLLQSWVPSGMDVALFVCWQMGLLALLLSGAPGGWVLTAVSAFGFWVRPEALLVNAAVWLDVLYRCRRHGRPLPLGVLACTAISGVLPLGIRYWYFGDMFPNTYYAKSFLTALDGISYIGSAFHYFGWALTSAGMAGCVLLAPSAPVFLILVLFYLAYFVAVGGDILSFRFALFLFPILLIGVGYLLATATRRGWRLAFGAVLFALTIAHTTGVYQHLTIRENSSNQRGHLYVPGNSRGTFETDFLAGQYLAENASAEDWLATDNIGAVGYLSKLRVLDFYGLVSREVAQAVHRHDGSVRLTLLEEYRRRQPRWVLCYGVVTPNPPRCGLEPVGDIAEFLQGSYERVNAWRSFTGYYRILLRRIDSG